MRKRIFWKPFLKEFAFFLAAGGCVGIGFLGAGTLLIYMLGSFCRDAFISLNCSVLIGYLAMIRLPFIWNRRVPAEVAPEKRTRLWRVKRGFFFCIYCVLLFLLVCEASLLFGHAVQCRSWGAMEEFLFIFIPFVALLWSLENGVRYWNFPLRPWRICLIGTVAIFILGSLIFF